MFGKTNKRIKELEEEIKKLKKITEVDGDKYMQFTNGDGFYTNNMPLYSSVILDLFIALAKHLKIKIIRSKLPESYPFVIKSQFENDFKKKCPKLKHKKH